MKRRSAQQQLSLFALTLALLTLGLAVFNWGLQYKMSLYQSHTVQTQAPAKLWVSKAAAVDEVQQEDRSLRIGLDAALLILWPLFRGKPCPWLCQLFVPWKLQLRAALRAFSFRPPPALA